MGSEAGSEAGERSEGSSMKDGQWSPVPMPWWQNQHPAGAPCPPSSPLTRRCGEVGADRAQPLPVGWSGKRLVPTGAPAPGHLRPGQERQPRADRKEGRPSPVLVSPAAHRWVPGPAAPQRRFGWIPAALSAAPPAALISSGGLPSLSPPSSAVIAGLSGKYPLHTGSLPLVIIPCFRPGDEL